MGNLRFSETSVIIYQSAWRKITDIFYFRQFDCENLKSRTARDVFRVPDPVIDGNTRGLVSTRVKKRPPEPQLKYRTLLNSYEKVCTMNFLPKQTAATRLRPLSAISRHQTFHRQNWHSTDYTSLSVALTYHIQGAKSPYGWQTKKPNYTCMAQTTPPHFLTGKSTNEPQHMRQASDLNVEWMLQRGTRRDTWATCNRGVWLVQQRSTINSIAIQTRTRCCVAKRPGIGGKEQKNSRDLQTASQAHIICLFHFLDTNN